MKRSILILSIFFGLAFLTILVWKQPDADYSQPESRGERTERQAISRFWDAYHRATEHRTRGDFEKAIPFYREALELKPDHEESLYYLGNSLLELGRYQEAHAQFERLVEVNPRSHRGYSQIGAILSSFLPGAPLDLARARRAFQRNIQLDPEESGPFLRLGHLALNQGDLVEAFEHFERAAGFASPEGMFWAGAVRFHQERYSEGVSYFQRVLKIAEQERRIAARGGHLEGDMSDDLSEKPSLSALDRAVIKSLLYLRWSAPYLEDSLHASLPSLLPAPLDSPSPFQVRLLRKTRGSSEESSESRREWFHSEDFPPSWNIGFEGKMIGSYRADFNGDGSPDLLILRWRHPPLLFFQESQQDFFAVRVEPFLELPGRALAAGVIDYNRDGRSDILIAERSSYEEALASLTSLTVPVGDHLRLFRNEGGGIFQDVTEEVGLSNPAYPGVVQIVPFDFNRDGWQDLLLVNGGFDARWKLPGQILLNYEGRFRHEAFVPDFQPIHTSGATVSMSSDGAIEVHLEDVGIFEVRPEPRGSS